MGQATPLCSWLDSKGWTGGAKVQLKINVVEVEVLQTLSLKRPLILFLFKQIFIPRRHPRGIFLSTSTRMSPLKLGKGT